MSPKLRYLVAASLGCAGVAFYAGAAQAMTVSVGSPSLSARLLVTVPVTVSCSPLDPSLTLVDENVGVTVEQASGRAIAHGSANQFSFRPGPMLFACDGTSTTIPVRVSADTAGVPFHGGNAIVSASAGAQAGTCFGSGCFITANQSLTLPPVAVRL